MVCCSSVLVVCFILVLFWGGCVCLVVGFKKTKKQNKNPKLIFIILIHFLFTYILE